MPIYEYECGDCKKTFSILRLSSSETEVNCTICGSKKVRKIMSSFSCACSSEGGGSASGTFGGGMGGGFGGG